MSVVGKTFSFIKFIFKLVLIIILVAAIALGLSTYMVVTTTGDIQKDSESGIMNTITKGDSLRDMDAQCIMVLGAGLDADGTPSPMLRDRLDRGVELYNKGYAPKLLLSGDNGQVEYDEVTAMYDYVESKGVPEEDICLDYAGFSTYDSAYRAREVFCVDRMIVVTQKYHLFRALYGCDKMGIRVKGVAAEANKYEGAEFREAREVLARAKDFVKWIIKPEPKYLGDKIPIDGDTSGTQQ